MIRLLLLAVLGVSAATKEAPEPAAPAVAEKTRLEVYLRERTERLKVQHTAQLKFMEDEKETWNSFWNKVKDDRQRFEVHVARQRLNLFESLSSLDSRDHPAAIADFEKLQAKLVQSFELTQRQRLADFFASRDERVKAFAAQQERDRSEFQSNAESAWRAQKSKVRGGSEGDEEPRRETRAERRERERIEREHAREERERIKEERRRAQQAAEEEEEAAREEEEPPARPKARKRARPDDEGVTFGPP